MAGNRDHRHTAALVRAVTYIRDLAQDPNCWKRVKTLDGIEISVRDADAAAAQKGGGQLPSFRGDGVIRNVTVQEMASLLRGFGARKQWDPRFEQGKLLDTLNATDNLVLSSQRGNLLVRSRDFVTANTYVLDNVASEALVVSASVLDALAPPHAENSFWGGAYVRAEANAIGWILRQEGRDVKVTYIVEVDVKGAIPTSLIKLIQVQAPLCINNVAQALARQGTLPFVLRGLGPFGPSIGSALGSEWVDPDAGCIFNTRVTVPAGCKANFCIAFPAKGRYVLGASIETNKRELCGEDGEVYVSVQKFTSRARFQGVVSESTQCLLQFKVHNTAATPKELVLKVRPYGTGSRFSVTRLSVLGSVGAARKAEAIYEIDNERVDDELSSPVDSAVGMDDKESVMEAAATTPMSSMTLIGRRDSDSISNGATTSSSYFAPSSVYFSAASSYFSDAPKVVENVMGIVDTVWETAVDTTANAILSSYVTMTSLLYGRIKNPTKSVPKSHYEQLDDERLLDLILEHVLDDFDA
ncbi:hypothetical protein BC830DRAFT_1125581 [Chytriomyces sp. MP71]|nr:hypothetical protein BC830DRAFT_1125581 [Chytriomyces sp. MP71]